MEDFMEALRRQGSQLATHDVDIAVLKDQNAKADDLHDKLLENDVKLQVGQARMETKLDIALGNGHVSKMDRTKQAGALGLRWTVLAGFIVAILKGLGWV